MLWRTASEAKVWGEPGIVGTWGRTCTKRAGRAICRPERRDLRLRRGRGLVSLPPLPTYCAVVRSAGSLSPPATRRARRSGLVDAYSLMSTTEYSYLFTATFRVGREGTGLVRTPFRNGRF